MNTLGSLLGVLRPNQVHPARSETCDSSVRTLLQRSYKVLDVGCDNGIVSIDAVRIWGREKLVGVGKMQHSQQNLREDRDELHFGAERLGEDVPSSFDSMQQGLLLCRRQVRCCSDSIWSGVRSGLIQDGHLGLTLGQRVERRGSWDQGRDAGDTCRTCCQLTSVHVQIAREWTHASPASM